MRRRCYVLLRRPQDVPIRYRGDVPLRRLGDFSSKRRWVFNLRRNCDVAGTYRETALRLRHVVLLQDGTVIKTHCPINICWAWFHGPQLWLPSLFRFLKINCTLFLGLTVTAVKSAKSWYLTWSSIVRTLNHQFSTLEKEIHVLPHEKKTAVECLCITISHIIKACCINYPILPRKMKHQYTESPDFIS